MGEEEAEGEEEEREAEEEEQQQQWQAQHNSYGVRTFVSRLLNTPTVLAPPLMMKRRKGRAGGRWLIVCTAHRRPTASSHLSTRMRAVRTRGAGQAHSQSG